MTSLFLQNTAIWFQNLSTHCKILHAVENKLSTTELDSLAGEAPDWSTWVKILAGHFKLRLHYSVYKNSGNIGKINRQ
jgi:hypothetical protein